MTVHEIVQKFFPATDKVAAHEIDEQLLYQFFDREEKRLSHIFGVVKEAKALSEYFPDEKDQLLASAYLHDIGYSKKLVKTGFHPIDSCIFTAGFIQDEQILKAVLFHSGAEGEAALRSKELEKIYHQLEQTLLQEDQHLVDLITYCDIQTSPFGTPLSMEYRVSEILSRYPEKDVVHQNIKSMAKRFFQNRTKVLQVLQEKISGYPWVFLDVDNTLITPGGNVGDKTKEAVRHFIKAGGKISLVTGKIPVSILSTIKELGLEEFPHICGNGSMIYMNSKTEVLQQLGARSNKFIDIIDKMNVPFCLYEAESIFYHSPEVNSEHIHYLESINEPTPIRQDRVKGDNAVKLLMFVDANDTELRKQIEERIRELDKEIFIVQTAPKLLEIMDMNQNKGNAIRQLTANYHHYSRFSVGVGDSENDLAMLNSVGKPYIVENASKQMKSYGFETLPSCDGEGVAILLNKMIESGGFPREA